MELPPLPSAESLQARLTATRKWVDRLIRLKPSPAAMTLARRALDDLTDAARFFGQPAIAEKPHALRAVEVCLDIAQWRLRGVERMITDGSD